MPIVRSRQQVFKTSPIDNDNGLAIRQSFDDGTPAVDSSGNQNYGTIVGTVTPTAGPTNSLGMKFNGGIGSYINCAQAFTTGTGSFTAAAWINTSVTGTRKQICQWGNDAGTSNDGIWFFVNTANKAACDLSNVAGVASAASVTDGLWHRVGIVNNAGSFQIYVEGQASGSAAARSPNIGSTYAVIGGPGQGSQAGSAWYFNGTIGDFRVWNRALSPAEMDADYRCAIAGFALSPDEWEMPILQAAGGFFSRYYYDMPAGNRLVA